MPVKQHGIWLATVMQQGLAYTSLYSADGQIPLYTMVLWAQDGGCDATRSSTTHCMHLEGSCSGMKGLPKNLMSFPTAVNMQARMHQRIPRESLEVRWRNARDGMTWRTKMTTLCSAAGPGLGLRSVCNACRGCQLAALLGSR